MTEYTCPHCKQPIYDDEALSCLFCGESLQREIGVFGKLKYGSWSIALGVVVALALIALMVL